MKKFIITLTKLLPVIVLGACVSTSDNVAEAGASSSSGLATTKRIQSGAASWYGPGFHGRKTASGERFNTHAMTAAHRTLPFGTRVRVVNEKTGRSVVVRINDRGPFSHGRVIDLAKAPASSLGITATGTARVALYQVQ
jgi:rare lipoprotein A